ncbi:MAG: DUF1376 domain-containing protein [Terriglobales bacterium]
MAEKGRPWMRWHVTRWRNSPRVLQMPLAAQGAYRNLLDAAWQQGGRLPNLPAVLWKYALAQSPEEFAAVAAPVLAMFTVSECGNWLSNETLMEECADRTTFADELSRKRSEAGKKGSAARWASDSKLDGKADGKTCSKTVANQDLPSPNVPPANELMANAWHKREEKKRDDKNADKTIEVAHWKCVDLGLASPRWTRPNDAMNAFDAALQTEHRLSSSGVAPARSLMEIADELGQLWLDYTRSAKGSGQFAMGPVKFFGEGWYRRTAAWRDSSTEETQALDGTAFIEEKRRKRANAFAADERR